MKSLNIRTILVLAGTLLIGFALGVLTAVQIRNAHLKKFRSYATREGFSYWTLHVIDPTPQQREQLLPVIRKYANENNKLRKEYRDDFINLMKEFKNELDPLLTQEQIDRIEKMGHSKRRRYPHKPSERPYRRNAHPEQRMPCP